MGRREEATRRRRRTRPTPTFGGPAFLQVADEKNENEKKALSGEAQQQLRDELEMARQKRNQEMADAMWQSLE